VRSSACIHRVIVTTRSDSDGAFGYSGINSYCLVEEMTSFQIENNGRNGEYDAFIYVGWRHSGCNTEAAAFHARMIVGRLLIGVSGSLACIRRMMMVLTVLCRELIRIRMMMLRKNGRCGRWLQGQARLPRHPAGRKSDREKDNKKARNQRTHSFIIIRLNELRQPLSHGSDRLTDALACATSENHERIQERIQVCFVGKFFSATTTNFGLACPL
jgi:hypothetical protein